MNEIEAIIDLLKERAIDSPFTLPRPSDDDLVVIEEVILLPIPKSIKIFLLEVSTLIIGSLEPITANDPRAHTHLPDLTAQAWSEGLPRDCMPICQKSPQAYYCSNMYGEIRLWENNDFLDEQWDDIWEWAERIWMYC
jgi:hypothetical protein